MKIERLLDRCPTCDEVPLLLSCTSFGFTMPDGSPARFDECMHHHRFNIRPYADYDVHYIHFEKIAPEIAELTERLEALKAIDAP